MKNIAINFMKNNMDRILYVALFGNALFFIWSNRYLPLQDYPDWVYQGHLFASYLKGNFSENYHLINKYPVPYSVVTVIMGLFGLIFQPETAGKIVLALYGVLFIAGSYYLLTSFQARLSRTLFYIPFIYLINFYFFRGTLSYVFGLGILFFCIGYILRTFLNHQRWNPYFIFGSSVLLFFTHGIVYITWLAFIFILAIALFHDKRALKNIIIGTVPSLVLTAAYIFLKNPVTNLDFDPASSLKALVINKMGAIGILSPLHEFSPFLDSTPSLGLPILVNLVFCLFLSALLILWFVKMKECASDLGGKYLAGMVILLILLFLFSPPSALHSDGFDGRFIYPLLLCLLTSLTRLSLNRHGVRLLKLFLIGIALTQVAYLDIRVSKVSEKMGEIMSTLRRYVQNSDFLFIDEGHFKFGNGYKRVDTTNGLVENFLVPRHQHLCTLTSLLSLELGKETPIFPVGLFYYDGKKKWVTSVQDIKDMAMQPENYIILGGNGGNEVIAETLSADYAMGLKENSFIIMTKR